MIEHTDDLEQSRSQCERRTTGVSLNAKGVADLAPDVPSDAHPTDEIRPSSN
jgi:hypothetical protein